MKNIVSKLIVLFFMIVLTYSCGKAPKDGINGTNGLNGQDGLSLVVNVETFVTEDGVTCNRTDIFQDKDRNNYYSESDLYQNGFLTCDGKVGAKGEKGDTGEKGEQGDKGDRGEKGERGLSADMTYQVVEIVDPCGRQHPNGFDEVILKLGNGKFLASFSDNANGLNTRFGVLPAGSYRTTDATNCNFTITNDGKVTWR